MNENLKLSSIMEVEFLDMDRRNAWGSVFQEIRNESNNFSYIIKDAKKSENKNLNRYRDVNPYDHSRVRLQRGDKDYINASLVNVASADRSYILTQGPLPATTGHFWLMVWEQKSKAVLMLNRVIEKNAVKCHQYWPVGSVNGGDNELLLVDVKLRITFLCERDESYYTIREFLITDLESQDSRKVLQFHYTTWPDFGVPESPASFLNFLFAVRESGVLNSNVGPPVVHCSAGIGRSGTFCLVDSCLILIEKSNDPNCINIRQQLLEMRHYRMGLIQTPDQLRFSYLAIIEGVKKVLPNRTAQNVPSGNENIPQALEEVFNSSENSCSEIGNGNGNCASISPPPPLPPRTARNPDDLSPTVTKTVSNFDFNECNGDLQNSTRKLLKPESNKTELNANCTGKEQYSDQEAQDRGDVIQDLIPGASFSKADRREGESPSALRKRARKEREEKTAAMVQSIKKKQKESELWEKRRLKRKRRK